MQKIIVSVVLGLTLVGCTYPYIHKKPEPITIENEKFLNKPTDKTWSATFNQLFNDIFTVESSDKDTGIIVATFETDRPANYIDCGVVRRKYKDANKVNHEYMYNYAEATKYEYNKSGQVYEADVTTKLETTITAKVKETGQGSTVTIDVDYALSRETVATNQADKSKLPAETEEIKFTSTKPYKTEQFSCTSTGAIEHNLLNGIR